MIVESNIVLNITKEERKFVKELIEVVHKHDLTANDIEDILCTIDGRMIRCCAEQDINIDIKYLN